MEKESEPKPQPVLDWAHYVHLFEFPTLHCISRQNVEATKQRWAFLLFHNFSAETEILVRVAKTLLSTKVIEES